MREPPPHLVRWEMSPSRGLGWAISWTSAFFYSAPLILLIWAFYLQSPGKIGKGKNADKTLPQKLPVFHAGCVAFRGFDMRDMSFSAFFCRRYEQTIGKTFKNIIIGLIL